MTLTRFVGKNAFRNKRRSILTVLSIGFSLLLLTLMMTLWRAFYLDEGSAESAQRVVVRHRVSLTFNLPGFYREKIRSVQGVVAVVPVSWFGGIYKDQKPENFFAQFGTDPEEFFNVFRDMEMLAATASDVSKVSSTVEDMFRNAPQPTKAESEKAFGLEFVAMLGNVKAFILSICSAVVFATLLVSANTMAMSIRERTREVAVLKTLGFTRRGVLGLFMSESVALSLVGGVLGGSLGWVLVYLITHSKQFVSFFP